MRPLLVVLALVISGCFGAGSSQLSDDDARQVAQEAVERFTADFGSSGGGDLRLVRGEFGDMDGMGDAFFEAEWGQGGTVRVEISVGSGDASFSIGLHCDAQRTIVSYGDRRIETRPSGTCLETLQDDSATFAEFDHLEVGNVTAHRDGRVTAVMASHDGNVTAHVDAHGRLTRIDLEDGGFMRMEYGKRGTIAMPEDASRMPAGIVGVDSLDGDYTWRAVSVEERVPLSEIEVRVQEGGQLVAAFDPAAGQESEAGFAFAFDDDGDGLFTAGDSFTIAHNDWDHDVVLWDLWADREVGDFP